MDEWDYDEEGEEDPPERPYGEGGRMRMLTRQCDTCIFHPGNRMKLQPGRVKAMVVEAVQRDSFIVCHSTLSYSAPPGFAPAVCRGFADRYSTNALRIFERIGGYEEVDPPCYNKEPTVTDTNTLTETPISPPPVDPPEVKEVDPLAPITSPLWRLPRGTRVDRLMPFVGHPVKVEIWPTRIASGGDKQYTGTLVAVASTTTGSTADFAIVQTTSGIAWALSTAQIAYLECTLRKGGKRADRDPATD